MIIHLTSDQEAHLSRLAARDGRSADDLAQEAVTRFLDGEARFAEAVSLGIAAAERSEFVAPEKIWEGVERILQS